MIADGSADGIFDAAFADGTNQLHVQSICLDHSLVQVVIVVISGGEKGSNVRTVPTVHVTGRRRRRRRRCGLSG